MDDNQIIYPSEPEKITDNAFHYDSFTNGKTLFNKKKGRLPAMGWNSWNAFGSGNTETLTKIMTDKIVELGLNELGYEYLVLDDGCYKATRINNQLSNEEVKFPGGFKALSDYIHSKGLKFGMYNDIGTNLCAGAQVGTCGHEKIDAQSYINWGVDFLKIDNCYYLWDNATFSNPENARYVFAPNIKDITVKGFGLNTKLSAVKDGILYGEGAVKTKNYVTGIGTFDGTNTGTTPIGPRSGELHFNISAPADGKYFLTVNYATSKENGIGEWLQIAAGNGDSSKYFYDYFLPVTKNKETFTDSPQIEIELKKGENTLRFMNHRRQENTLCSYAAMLEGLQLACPDNDIVLSLCEWGKTQPQNWGYKVGDSWRILNDITFQVGSDGNPGHAAWSDPGTPSVTSQYNKAVIMDEFAGLDKGWNDPDMLTIGMEGLSPVMNKTHFSMWCLMNSPLMLGLDLRRVQKGDELYNIISNKDLIDLNQDKLGIQAKRIWTSYKCSEPDKEYIQDNARADVLAKPLADGSVAVSVINLSETDRSQEICIEMNFIKKQLGIKTPSVFEKASCFEIVDLWKKTKTTGNCVKTAGLEPCDSLTVKVIPVK